MIDFNPYNQILLVIDAVANRRVVLQALRHGRNLKQSEIDRFCEQGVAPLDLVKAWATQVDYVAFNGEYFEFTDGLDDGGEQVFTMGVISDIGLIDVIAWHPSSGRLATWLGLGFALGESQISAHMDDDLISLPVFQSPLGWLRAGCQGIVIVRKTFTHIVLKKVPVLLAEDERHRIELAEMFPSAGPRILMRGPERPAADIELEVAA